MDELKEKFEFDTLVENVKDYASLRARIITLTVADASANLIANLITNGALILFGLMFCLFGSVALALWLGQKLENYVYGFLIVSGFYLFLGLIILLIKDKYLEKPLMNTVIKNLFKNSSNGELNS